MFGKIILNFGIQRDKIQNILNRLSNLNFTKNFNIKYVLALGETSNIDRNRNVEIM